MGEAFFIGRTECFGDAGWEQGLMQAAMVASTPAMAAAIRRVLGGLHSQKAAPGVDAMLLHLYEPLIFRSLLPQLCWPAHHFD